MKLKSSLTACLCIVFFTKGISQNNDLERSRAIDSIVNKYAKEYSIVGLSIGIVNEGESSTRHYGVTDLQAKHPVSDDTMFHLASISKLFTSTAIMQLVESNQLNLEDKLVDVLPVFKMKDSRYKDIQIKHLLTHSSGLMWNNKIKNSPDNQLAVSQYIEHLRKRKLNFAPGEKLSSETYSNVAFDLLGSVVEKISGKRFDEYVAEYILVPLGMTQSTYFYEEVEIEKLAVPHIVAGGSRKINQLNNYGIDNKKKPIINGKPLSLKSYEVYGEDYEHNPSGNLISSASEMNLWILEYLSIYENSSFEGILEHGTVEQMWTTQHSIKNSNTSIGWAWWIREEESKSKLVFHAGSNPGFCSIMLVYPEEDFGITVLCNGMYAQEAVWNLIPNEIESLYLGK